MTRDFLNGLIGKKLANARKKLAYAGLYVEVYDSLTPITLPVKSGVVRLFVKAGKVEGVEGDIETETPEVVDATPNA